MRRATYVSFAALAAAYCLFPFAWQVLTSLRPEAELTSLGFPSRLTLASYESAIAGRAFGSALLQSALVAGATALMALALGAPAAFALARLPVRGRRALLAAVLSVSMFPPIATAGSLYLLARDARLLDTAVALVIAHTAFALPLVVWVLHGFFRDVPVELYRAARVDGAKPFQAFARIVLPVSAPALATTGILAFVFSYSEFLFALTLTSSPERRTVPVAIALFAADQREPWGEIAAASVLSTLPIVALALVLQKRIAAGLTAGALKG